MPLKKHKPEEIVAKLRQVDVLLSQGRSVGETPKQADDMEGLVRSLVERLIRQGIAANQITELVSLLDVEKAVASA